MWKYAASLLQKFSGIAPLKEFFKYISRRISNDFLDKEPNIDFKSGVLQLQDLPLSTLKINSTILASSPYVLHEGILKKLRITLPNFSELTSKSIEVYVSGLYLTLRPNKEFELRFNEKLKQIKENSKFYDDDDIVRDNINVDTSMDFFREVIKQILTNIKINVENICVRVFMNRPSEKNSPQKPQYFLMARMPFCQVEKINELDSSKLTDPSEKFKLEIPQVSLHILREDMRLNEYSNLFTKPGDFPFNYPPVTHPSTILLIGSDEKIQPFSNSQIMSPNSSQVHCQRKCILAVLKMTRNAKLQKVQKNIKADVSNLEIMVEGTQIQVLLKFVRQLEEFKMLYNRSLQSLKNEDKDLYKKISLEVSQDIDIRNFEPNFDKKGSSSHHLNMNASLDIFASMVFNTEQSFDHTEKRTSLKKQNIQPGYLDTIFQLQSEEAKGLKNKVKEFQGKFTPQEKKKLIEAGNIDYKQESDIRFKLGVLCVYVLKYNSFKLIQYERNWLKHVNGKPAKINEDLPCSYFLLKLRTVSFQSEKQQAVFNIKKLQLLDVNICRKPEAQQSLNSGQLQFREPIRASESLTESDLFKSFKSFGGKDGEFELDSPTHTTSSKTLERFVKKINDHFCCNVLLAISNRSPQPKPQKSAQFKKYNFFAEKSDASSDVYDWAITVKSSQQDKNQTKVDVLIKSVTCVMDLVVQRDLLNILHPIFMYRGTVENISLKRQQISGLQQNSGPSNLFSNKALYYSRYDMSEELLEKQPKGQLKNKVPKVNQPSLIYNVCLDQFKIAVRSLGVGNDLIEKQKNKFEDKQSFEYADCLCKYKGDAIALIIQNAQLKSTGRKKLNVCRIQLSIFQINAQSYCKQSYMHSFEPLLSIVQNSDKSITRIYYEQLQKKATLNVSIPKISIPLLQKPTNRMLDAISCLLKSWNELNNYSRHLKEQMRRLECVDLISTSSMSRKAQKIKPEQEEDIDVMLHVGVLQIQVINTAIFLKDIIVLLKNRQKVLRFNDLLVIDKAALKSVLRNTDSSAQKLNNFDAEIMDMTKYDNEKEKSEFAERVLIYVRNVKDLQITKLASLSDDRAHFHSLRSLVMAFQVKISMKSALQDSKINTNRLQGSSNRANKHNLNRLETIVEEPGQALELQNIEIVFSNPLIIRICQLLPIIEPIQKFTDTISSAVSKFTRIQAPPQIGSRKNSEEVTNNRRDINLKIKAIYLDLFPVFEKKQDRGIDILSNSRSYAEIRDAVLKVSVTSQGDIEGNVDPKFILDGKIQSIGYSFLYFTDNLPERNTLLLSYEDLSSYGFKQILVINKIDLDFRTKNISSKLMKIQVAATIDEINYESTAKTITYLMHYMKHLTNSLSPSSPAQQIKKDRKPSVIELIQDESSAEDLQQIQRDLLKFERQQKQQEEQFKLCKLGIVPKTGLDSKYQLSLHVKMIEIKKLILNVIKGNQFDFLPYVGQSIQKPVVFFLNDDNTMEKCYDIEIEGNNQATKNYKRLLKNSMDKSNNLRVIAEEICFEIHNYVNKQSILSQKQIKEQRPQQDELNFIARFQVKSLMCLVNKVTEDIFYILKSTSNMIILTEIEANKVKISCSEPRLMLGFTSNLSFVSAQMAEAEAQLKKVYHKLKDEPLVLSQENEKPTELYLLIPECTITLNLQLKGLQFISNQVMRIPELYFHSRLCNYREEENKKFIKSWFTEVITKNLGSLLGNGAVALISKSIWLLMALFKEVVLLPRSAISLISRRRR